MFDAGNVSPVVCMTQIVFHGEEKIGKCKKWDIVLPVSVTQTYTRPKKANTLVARVLVPWP